jgi:uncharacterized protein YwgA
MAMTDIQKSAVIAALIKAYRDQGLFCGETHVQKSVYFMQELLGVPFDFEYLLYKYGPFSFELQSHLASMRADNMISVQPLGLGATFEVAEQMRFLEQRLPRTIATYESAVKFVVSNLGRLRVKQLEPLATALFFTKESPDASATARAVSIREVKPHVSSDEARKAVEAVDDWKKSKLG